MGEAFECAKGALIGLGRKNWTEGQNPRSFMPKGMPQWSASLHRGVSLVPFGALLRFFAFCKVAVWVENPHSSFSGFIRSGGITSGLPVIRELARISLLFGP
jgi:hypothetical protein